MLKSKVIVALIAGVAATSMSFAEGDSSSREACKAERAAMKAQIDTNGDGEVSAAERTAHMTSVFYEISGGQDATTIGDIKAHREAKRANSDCRKGKKGGKRGQNSDREKPDEATVVTLDDFLAKGEKRKEKRKDRKKSRDE